jgi:hypothetical protein
MTTQDRSPHGTCAEFESDLVLHHYGECPEPERLRVDTHLRSCPGCARFLRDLGAILPRTVTRDEPPQSFWLDYTRELRKKITQMDAKVPWWRRLCSVRPWPVPALATGLVLILALILTFATRSWRPTEIPPEDQALLAVLPIAENLDFFRAMELLDVLDLLEATSGLANKSA